MDGLLQIPSPGQYSLRYRGDIQRFSLKLPADADGRAWLRTNIGRGTIGRHELINRVEKGKPVLARDWHDVPMPRVSEIEFILDLPLPETGIFEAKAFFLAHGEREPLWPSGGNTVLKVEPAAYCSANTVYTAFVRQFGRREAELSAGQRDERIEGLESLGYAVIPPSGTFRDLIRNLDVILDRMQFRILQLLPIHPTPTTFARMGRFGSPFAVIDFMDVDPALAEFDRQTTPLEQFRELLDEVHRRGAKLFLDVPVNHTGWASKLQGRHPDWFERNDDSTFRSPGAWGVTWEDLSQLDYGRRRLWEYLADVFLYWCSNGVDGFRCDAGYMVPCGVWEYVVAKVRERYPDTIFMLEGLGGKVETTEDLLGRAGLNWAYSELFQQYTREQVESYLPGSLRISGNKGMLMIFAETHDNDRLAGVSETYARMRTTMSAMLSDTGGFGITNGVEWFATKKVDVHGAPSLNWGDEVNQVDNLARLNTVIKTHPAFRSGVHSCLVHTGSSNSVALRRGAAADDDACLVLVNLDAGEHSVVEWRKSDFDPYGRGLVDLLSGEDVNVEGDGESLRYSLDEGEVLCLCRNAVLPDAAGAGAGDVPSIRKQLLKAKAIDLFVLKNGIKDVGAWNVDESASRLAAGPHTFCERMFGSPVPVVTWSWPADAHRTVMVPPGHLLFIRAPSRFRVELRSGKGVLASECSILMDDGTWFALLLPLHNTRLPSELTLSITAYEDSGVVRRESAVLYLSGLDRIALSSASSRAMTIALDRYALCTNGRGGMAQVHGAWGRLRSRYDAFLAGNLHPHFPVDRHVMLTRCRAWLQYRGYSQEINADSLETFSVEPDGSVSWAFQVPAGLGKLVPLTFHLAMLEGANRIDLTFGRGKSRGAQRLDDGSAIRLVLRPDLEDRHFHDVTKAYAGPEESWPGAVQPQERGFSFSPGGSHGLHMLASESHFILEHEWSYSVPLPLDAERGLDGSTDLFSPGYFAFDLRGGDNVVLSAEILTGDEAPGTPALPRIASAVFTGMPGEVTLVTSAERAMRDFVVERAPGKTVIAGYPWFLDWGRDTLICLRGLIRGGYLEESREILMQFAALEENGTLPNMLRGADSRDRDTSDAPLWFFVACSDLLEAEGNAGFLNTGCGGRTVADVLESIVSSYISGTPNGIIMDSDTGLVFSPSHFTWMDTNYPAGTPRQGYPIEIQALWYAALRLLANVSKDGRKWLDMAVRLQSSIARLYVRDGQDYLSDCLHCGPGTVASEAIADDALRPNQLLAVTLGAFTDKGVSRGILASCEELLVPGGIRSLADRPVRHAIPVSRDGTLLNDPQAPYWGQYSGDEDSRRKPAYHNGTAWTWMFPSYSEALVTVYGERAKPTARAILGSSAVVINRGCVGHVPEILDGNRPHLNRGCGAQAWGATELYRVLSILG